MNHDERRRALIALGRTMSAADLSILQAALQELDGKPAVMLSTVPASKNDVLWAEMTVLGWLSEAGTLDAVAGAKLYTMPASSKPWIAQYLADLDHSGAMTKVINELREAIPPQLIDAVRNVDGTPADLAILLAGIVESTMRRALKPELHDEFLREVGAVAEKMRSL